MKEQIRYYKLRAQEYEAVYQKPERQADLIEIRQYLSQQFSQKHLLEIACGTGYWTQILASSTKSILATDINPEVLVLAKQKDYPNNNVTFQIQDIDRLAPPVSSFEGLFGGFILSHISRTQWQAFFSTCLSQIKAGSELLFLDNRYVEGSSTPISRKDQGGDTYQSRTLNSGQGFEVMKNFPVEEELKKLLIKSTTEWEWINWRYYWLLKCKKS